MSPLPQQPTLLEVDPYARHDEDFYATPAWQTLALGTRLPMRQWDCDRYFEPCVGDGAIVRVLDRLPFVTNDLVARGAVVPDFLLDARKASSWTAFTRSGPLDVILTNPPFDVAFDIAQHAYEAARTALVLLLRLSWLEPTESRGAWLKLHPPTRLIVMPRYDYRGNGKTDSVTSAWMVWVKRTGLGVAPGIDFVTKQERDALMGLARSRGLS